MLLPLLCRRVLRTAPLVGLTRRTPTSARRRWYGTLRAAQEGKGVIVPGRTIAQHINQSIQAALGSPTVIAHTNGATPRLAVLLADPSDASCSYVRLKREQCASVGIASRCIHLSSGAGRANLDAVESLGEAVEHVQAREEDMEELLLQRVRSLNADPEVHGVLIQLPLPRSVDTQRVLSAVAPCKDVDGFSTFNVAPFLQYDLTEERDRRNRSARYAQLTCVGEDALFKDPALFRPSTNGSSRAPECAMLSCPARAVLYVLHHYDVDCQDMDVVVLGRGRTAGSPIALALTSLIRTRSLTTVEVDAAGGGWTGSSHRLGSDSALSSLRRYVEGADVVVSAVGIPQYIQAEWLQEAKVVIDVGCTSSQLEGKDGRTRRVLLGDVERAAKGNVPLVTPVPGGVGPVTVSMLLQNTLETFYWQERGRR